MTQETIRFGLIGAGAIAQSYVQAFNDSHSARIVAVCDLRKAAATALAERLACDGFQDLQDMLDRASCDAILICTPPNTHQAICLSSLRRGKHVLCEKPLTLDSASAQEMFAAADEVGAVLAVASKFRFVEDIIRAKAILESGVLGEISFLENTFSSWVDMSSRWNSQPDISGGGVLIDNGTHSVDLVRYLLGSIVEVLAVQANGLQKLPVEETVHLHARAESGAMACAELSWSLNRERQTYVEIYGSRGKLEIGWKESRFRLLGNTEWESFGRGYNKIEAFRRQIRHFCRAIRDEESLLLTAADSLASVQVIERAYESLRKQHWVATGPRSADERLAT